MMHKMTFVFSLILVAGFASSASANCLNPAGVAGNQMYNVTSSKMQYCNGTDWIDMSGGDPGVTEPGDQMGNHTATQNLDMNTHKIIDMGTPTDGTDLVTKAYVDSLTGANETDPKVGALTNNAWCQAGASTIECTTTSVGTAANILVATDLKPEGTWNGGGVGTTWTKRDLTTVLYSNIAGTSLSSSQISLPAGTYYIDAVIPFHLADFATTRLVKVSNSSVLLTGTSTYGEDAAANGNVETFSHIKGVITLAAADSIRIEYYKTSAGTFPWELGHRGGHVPATVGKGTGEVYSIITVIKAVSDNSCSLDGQRVANGASGTFYNVQTSSNCAAASQSRTCTSGTLGGSASYQYGSCANAVVATYIEQNSIATNLTTYTHAGVNFGTADATRRIVVGIHSISGSARSISSVTIGGVAATSIVNNGSDVNTSGLYAAHVPTGTTGDVVVTFSGGTNGNTISIWSLIGGSSTAASDTATASVDPTATVTLDIPANGTAIAICRKTANTTMNWTGLVERFDSWIADPGLTTSGSSQNFTAAQTGFSVSCTRTSASSEVRIMVGSWGP